MANNRLYVGNIYEKQWVCISKGFGVEWREISSDKLRELNALITTPDMTGETELGGKTSLRFFTEYDDLYDEVFAKDSGWTRVTP